METKAPVVPSDFLPVPGNLPSWIEINKICHDARRFVALHTLSNFNAVAINDGQRVFTTDDQGGEFRRHFRQLIPGGSRSDPSESALVYDCHSRRQWLAPRPSAIQFLNLQF